MNLFLKIFLWFMAAIALMVGVVLFLNWTIQTEPVVSRWQTSMRNQMNIYAETAAQIYDNEGEAGLSLFIQRVKSLPTVTEVDVVNSNGKVLFADVADLSGYRPLIENTFAAREVQLELSAPGSALAARNFTTKSAGEFALIVRWARPQPVPVFGETRLRYARWIGLFLTAIIVCYALALYLSRPIGKLRNATQKLAKGDLETRVVPEVGKRRDEIADLARDFDEMAERIESLITSQKRLSRDISHELRSPLARMNVALEIAKQKSGPEMEPLLARIEGEAGRLNEMISLLLTFSKLEAGAEEFEKHSVSLAGLLKQVVSDADYEARAAGKRVIISAAEECRVMGNESILRSAIENVLRNAVKYTAEGTEVNVSLACKEKKALIAVSDEGGGVPDPELENLFKPFYRVGEARDRGSGGTGLGLAIAEQAVKSHKGRISARNNNGGLVVEIELDRVIS